jgi:excisionase family DNA binding protein
MTMINNRLPRSTQNNEEKRSKETVSLSILLSGDDEDLLTVQEVAAACRVDDTTARRWIKSGALSAVALPRRGRRSSYRVKRGELRRVLTPKLLGPT